MLVDFIMSLSAQTLAQSYLVWWVICCACAYNDRDGFDKGWVLLRKTLYHGTLYTVVMPVMVICILSTVWVFFKIQSLFLEV